MTADGPEGVGYSRLYADLYLEARDRASANAMAVPHEVLATVFENAAWGEAVNGLGGDEWAIWTPDGREKPVYIHTPTLVEDTSTERGRFVELLEAAGVGTTRFINVLDGQKGSFDTDHKRDPNDPEITGNYGVKGGRGGDDDGLWLVDIDVDDYDEAKDSHERVDELRDETLAVKSAHTTVEKPGHLYVAVDGDPTTVIRDLLGRDVENPVASFGEIRVDNQYCVGPGSAVLCGCDRCAPTATECDHDHGIGRYELATEQPPIVWTEDEFREFLLTDPVIKREAEAADARDAQLTGDRDTKSESDISDRRSGTLDADVKDRFEHAKSVDPDVRAALDQLDDPDDRSEADAVFASAVAPWVDYDEDALRELLDEYGTKWQSRPDESYRESILNYALSDRDVTSAIPVVLLETLQPDELKRYLRKRDIDWPPSNKVTSRIRNAVRETMENKGYAVLEAPTGANKTGVAAETQWSEIDNTITGGHPVVLFCETHDARAEVADRAESAGLEVLILRGRKELCDMASGKYDPVNIDEGDPDAPEPIALEGKPASEWFDTMCDERGIAFSVAHDEAEELLNRQGRQCPCCEGPYVCPSKTQWPSAGLVDDNGEPQYDLVVATDPFAFVPSLRANTNVIHDEQPTYTEDFGLEDTCPEAITSRVRRAVTAFLGLSDGGPDTFEALVTLARECAEYDAAPWNEHAAPDEKPDNELADRWLETFEALSHEPTRRWYFGNNDAHTLAPALARGIWKAIVNSGIGGHVGFGPFDVNGRASATVRHEPPRLDEDARNGEGWNRTYVTVVVDDTNQVRRVRNTPDFSTCRSVVGLDARPNSWLWQRNVHSEMSINRLLDTDERRYWRYFEREQTVVGVGNATRPAGKDGRYFTPRHARAIIQKLRDHGGDEFRTVGCPSGFEEEIRELMLDAGVPADELDSMHYGEEKSRNDFAEETLGLVYGCIDPGDDYVLDWLAECGLNAHPERSDADCNACGGDGCQECDYTGHKRAHGRGFNGPDADYATELLETVRETHVAQMVGRFGRQLDTENGERNVTYVVTDAVPHDLIDYQVKGVASVATNLQEEIVSELEDRPSATTREIADAVGCNKEHVRQTLVDLEDRSDIGVQRSRGVAAHGADAWHRRDSGPIDDVQLGVDEIANGGVGDVDTWSLAIRSADAVSAVNINRIFARVPPAAVTGETDPPPNPTD